MKVLNESDSGELFSFQVVQVAQSGKEARFPLHNLEVNAGRMLASAFETHIAIDNDLVSGESSSALHDSVTSCHVSKTKDETHDDAPFS